MSSETNVVETPKINSNREILLAVMRQVREICVANQLPPPLSRISNEYAVNFDWQIKGKKEALQLSYSPKRNQFTPTSNSDWIRNTVWPLLQPLLASIELNSTTSKKPQVVKKSDDQIFDPLQLASYFVSAVAALKILEPLSQDNVNFGIICERTKQAVSAVLADSASKNLDAKALTSQLEKPVQIDFNSAKEYLEECLSLCQLTQHQILTN